MTVREKIEKRIAELAEETMFEPQDQFTGEFIASSIRIMVAEAIQKREIYDGNVNVRVGLVSWEHLYPCEVERLAVNTVWESGEIKSYYKDKLPKEAEGLPYKKTEYWTVYHEGDDYGKHFDYPPSGEFDEEDEFVHTLYWTLAVADDNQIFVDVCLRPLYYSVSFIKLNAIITRTGVIFDGTPIVDGTVSTSQNS